MVNLSAVVLTKNEQENIEACLSSLQFCDEVILIDDFSEDNTVKLARKFKPTIITRKLNGDFSVQRNYALSKAQGKWVLFIDADEVVSPKLQKEILKEVTKQNNLTSGYYFRRTDFLWKQEVNHGEVGDVRLLRLAQKGSGKWDRRVHEHWHVIGETKEFKNPILHYPHPTLQEFLREINERTTWHALANNEEGKKAAIYKIITHPLGKFIYGYILRAGFLDGIAGFVIAVVMSLHSFISWSKLWFLQRA